MKNRTTDELKSWMKICIVIYISSWVVYVATFIFGYLGIQWIIDNHKTLFFLWGLGHLSLLDIIPIYYELLKRKEGRKGMTDPPFSLVS